MRVALPLRVAGLLAFVLAACSCQVLADGSSRPAAGGGCREIPEFTPDHLEAARAIGAKHRPFARILGDAGAYEAVGAQFTCIGDEPTGVLFIARLATPVTSNGPWPDTECGETFDRYLTYHDIRELFVVVDLKTEAVVGLQPKGATMDQKEGAEAEANKKCVEPSLD